MDYNNLISSFNIIIPEIFLITSALFLLILGVYRKGESLLINYLSSFSVIITIILLYLFSKGTLLAFNNMYISNNLIVLGKILILLCVLLSIMAYTGFIEVKAQINRFEYLILVLISSVGMMLMVSANDLLNLYLSLELQSLPLYILAAFNRDNSKSTEAGIKYFTLGALASGLLLYGISLIYGFTGSLSFTVISNIINENIANNSMVPTLIIGMILMSVGLCFKISAVPFHMWAPDVYQGSPTPVTLFFATAPKLSALILFYRVFNEIFTGIFNDWSQIVYFVSLASMLFGSIAALMQTNIKRLMAYSSIAHVGYMLLAVLVGKSEAFVSMLIYFSIYLFSVFGVFAIIMFLSLHNHNLNVKSDRIENVKDLAGLSKNHPVISFILMIFMLSLAGIPPLAGFFAKFYIFTQAISAGFYVLVIFAVMSSVIGAFYYLRIIKVIYFEESTNNYKILNSSALCFIISLSLFVNIFFIFIIKDWISIFKFYM